MQKSAVIMKRRRRGTGSYIVSLHLEVYLRFTLLYIYPEIIGKLTQLLKQILCLLKSNFKIRFRFSQNVRYTYCH